MNGLFCSYHSPHCDKISSHHRHLSENGTLISCFNLLAKGIDAVILGCDRIARNGDLANKIGTYQLAVLAKHHGVLFYSALPTTTIDLSIPSGNEIPIEERPPEELTSCGCKLKNRVAADGIECWNPAFDVTPAELVTSLVTERGVCDASKSGLLSLYPERA